MTAPSEDKKLRSQKDIDMYIRDNMGLRVPLDGPLWRVYFQENYDPIDQEHLPEEHRAKGLVILKGHHSFCDGVSIMCMALALSEEYGREYFVPGKDAKWYEALAIRLMSPFYLPKIINESILSKPDKNFLTKRKEQGLSGNLNVASSNMINFN